MSAALEPVLTTVGLGRLANAQGTGLQAVISQIAVGRGTLVGGVYKGYAPAKTATALKGEMIRLPILSGSRLDPAGFTVLSVLPASPGEYPINEIGIYLSDGTLLALWSDPVDPLSFKSKLADVEIGFDLLLDAIPTELLAITVLNPDVPDTAGVLAELLATDAHAFVNMVSLTLKLASLGVKV